MPVSDHQQQHQRHYLPVNDLVFDLNLGLLVGLLTCLYHLYQAASCALN